MTTAWPDKPARVPELLAPAGDFEALRAAAANGADAVYFGLADFNARQRAANFRIEQLPEIVAYLHDRNIRAHVAFNTLIFSDELPAAARYLAALAQAGVDAVIVQDIGLAHLAHELVPDLPLHASTQMTLTEPRGIGMVRALGMRRVILARELSLAEIRQLTAGSDMPVETFVHGALCVAYSGQCLTSEAIGGRSANRGQCAQACRLPYELIVDGQTRDLGDKAYLLSPKDLAAWDRMADLAAAGVASVKIEGRLKSAHYVAAATRAYRAALDAVARGQSFTLAQEMELDLAQSFSRGFAHGFLDGVDHQQLVHGRFPKSRGVFVGRVTQRTERGLVIEVDRSYPATLKPGDGIVFDDGHPEQDEQGGRLFEVHPRGRAGAGGTPRLEIVFGRGMVSLDAVALGARVWKTDDPAVRRRLEQSFARELVHRPAEVWAVVHAQAGQPLALTLRDAPGHVVTVRSDMPMEEARRHPVTVALLREQLGRLGDTPFTLAGVELISADGPTDSAMVMTPKSLLNDLRRQAAEQLQALRQAATRCPIARPDALDHLRQQAAEKSTPVDARLILRVLVRNLAQLETVVAWGLEAMATGTIHVEVTCDFEDPRKYAAAVAQARAAGMTVGLASLRIIKPGEEGWLRLLAEAQPDEVLIRNLGALDFFTRNHPRIRCAGDYSLNVANELSAAWLFRAGLVRLTPGYDLNFTQLSDMLKRGDPARFEVVVHQHMPMFHMEHCVFAATLSQGRDHRDCGRPCEKHAVDLRDRVGVNHALLADAGCRNTVFNGQAQSAAAYVARLRTLGVTQFRVEMLRESKTEARQLLEHYQRVLRGQQIESLPGTGRSLSVLNQLGVTAGPLEFA